MKNKFLLCAVSDVKLDAKTGTFTCYGNVKGNVDHALDKSMPGCYTDSIKMHKAEGTMPGMFWMHKSHDYPTGAWMSMEEDSHGLKMTGQLAVGEFSTPEGERLHSLAKLGALKEFSIGYQVVEEEWNPAGGFNELRKIHITEVSWVTKGCNDQSLLVDMKSKMADGELPTKRELEKLLRDECGFSKRQANSICNNYNPVVEEDMSEVAEMIKQFVEA